MTESKPRRDFESFFPEPVRVDEVGWERFLSLWNDDAMTLVKHRLLMCGLPLGPGGRGLRKKLEEENNIHLPPVVFDGGLSYPPRTDIEQVEAERIFKLMKEAIPEIKKHRPSWPKLFEWEALVNGGLRYAGAGSQAIDEAERRLGMGLPKSYREFLSLSNGWLANDDDFLPVEQVKRMEDADPEFAKEWIAEGSQEIPDEQYFQYDLNKQYHIHIREKYIPDCLVLSEHYGVSSRWYLLNPAIRFEDGEWEAWHLEIRIAGARRFRSFKAMMEWLYRFEIAELRKAVYEMT